MPAVRLSAASKIFPATSRTEPPLVAVDAVDLDIEAGEIYGIIGYSGAGKSTLVRLINALETVSSGSVQVNGVELSGLSERRLRRVRLGIGMIFQQFNLFDSRTVWGNVEYPLRVAGVPRAEHQARISQLLHFVGLADKAHSYPDQLSGGQKQRVGIARALATSPSILLADEVTSALDPETTREVLELLKRINRELGVTIILITHEMEVIKSIAHRVAVMESGRIVERGPVFDVFSNPQSDAARRFVSTIVSAVPDGEQLDQLVAKHPGRIVTLSFVDGVGSQTEVFAALAAGGVDFQLVYGGITDVQGSTFGHLTFALGGRDDIVESTIAALRVLTDVSEVN
jgi:D-methionine transport system ATP-binding protein